MNRSNVGNQITNGMQILSVGATTKSAMLRRKKTIYGDEYQSVDDASSTLNNNVEYEIYDVYDGDVEYDISDEYDFETTQLAPIKNKVNADIRWLSRRNKGGI